MKSLDSWCLLSLKRRAAKSCFRFRVKELLSDEAEDVLMLAL